RGRGGAGAGGARRLRGLAPASHDRPQLAPGGQAEVQRGADALGGERQAVPRGVSGEEHAVLDSCAQLVGYPVPLIAERLELQLAGQTHGRLLDVVRRPEGPDADAQLVARGEVPAVAGADVARI